MSVAYSISPEHRSNKSPGSNQGSPGPGLYDDSPGQKIVRDSSPEWSFAKAGRKGDQPTGGMGPGEYQSPEKQIVGGKFNVESKFVLQTPGRGRPGDRLGPGAYDPKVLSASPSITFGSKLQKKAQNQAPGPGEYTPTNTAFGKAADKKSSGSQWDKSTGRQGGQTHAYSKSQFLTGDPGPGQYNPTTEVHRVSNPKVSFGKTTGRADNNRDKSPGPGAYDTPNKIGSGPSIGMGNRPKTAKDDRSKGFQPILNAKGGRDGPQQSQTNIGSPGPGMYDANDIGRVKSPQVTFGKGQRSDIAKKQDAPGPGNYAAQTSKAGPSFTIGSKPKSKQQEHVPGPGHYKPSDALKKDTSRSFKIPSANQGQSINQSQSMHNLKDPGPGQYDSQKPLGKDAPGFTMGTKKTPTRGPDNPGPGAYDGKDDLQRCKSPSYNMGNSLKKSVPHSNEKSQLGPGAYDSQLRSGGPSYTIGGKGKEPPRNESPGPGAFDRNDDISRAKGPSYKLGQSKREGIVNKNARSSHPGPGNYSVDDSLGRGPKFTMGQKKDQKHDTLSPGPGAYQPKDSVIKDQTKSFRMGSSTSRNQIVPKDMKSMPGPGNYDSVTKIGSNTPQFTFGGKKDTDARTDSPGPGGYEPQTDQVKERVITYSMGKTGRSELVSSRAKDSPGPGGYESPVKIGKGAPSFTIGGKSPEKRRNDHPGPGTYDQRDGVDKAKSPSFQMGTTKRADMVSKNARDQPGPGNYVQDSFVGKSVSYSIGQKRGDKPKDFNPGPGSYTARDDQSKERVQAHKFGDTRRSELVSRHDKEKPGPGNYDSPLRSGGPQFTIGGKSPEKRRDANPGPGSYQPGDSITKDRPQSVRFSNTTRSNIVEKGASQQPGPGNYDSPTRMGKDCPTYTIGGKGQDRERNKNPGPGEYNGDNSPLKERVRTYKFGDTNRADIVSSTARQQPGPGNYESPTRIGSGGPQFTIGTRKEGPRQDSKPGPGAYDAVDSLTRDKTPTANFGNTTRGDIVSKAARQNPGPGNYSEGNRMGQGPKFTIASRREDTRKNDHPGPGQYNEDASPTKERARAYKFGDTNRADIVSREAKNAPGPGNYDSPSRIGKGGPQFTIGEKSPDRTRNDKPGPGNYDPSDNQTKERIVSYKISHSSRPEIVGHEHKSKPGPGAYDSPSRTGGPNYTIGSRRDSPNRNLSPGPGGYDPTDSHTKENVVSHKFGDTKRSEIVSKSQAFTPGPGNYDSPERIGKGGPQYAFGERRPDTARNNSPGPGGYDPVDTQVKEKIVSYKMSPTRRSDIVSSDQRSKPGPGMYEDPVKLGKGGPQYSIGKKGDDLNRNANPGPGSYEPGDEVTKTKNQAASFGKTGRADIVGKNARDQPGPGVYESPSKLGKGVQYSMGEKREGPERNKNPGPGQYNDDHSPVKERVQTYKFGDTKRAELVSKDERSKPGPGNYDSPQRMGDGGPTYTIGSKSPDRQRDDKPGPGSYDPSDRHTKEQPVTYSLGSTKRSELVSKEARNQPGPGGYDSPSRMGKGGPQYTIGEKSPDRRRNDLPGPGNYDPQDSHTKSRVVSHKLGDTKRADIVGKDQSSKPGPGAYDSPERIGKGGPQYTINGKSPDSHGNQHPGPGAYDKDDSPTRVRQPAHMFGDGTKRADLVSKAARDQPGPGNYSNDDGMGTGPKFTIGGKRDDGNRNSNPGPGSYDAKESHVKETPQTHAFGKTGRSNLVSNEAQKLPGPGGYESPSKLGKGVSYSMGEKRPDNSRHDSPGPGAYEPAHGQTKEAPQSFGFGAGQPRSDIVSKRAKDQPGPGAYDSPSRLGKGTSATILGKSPDRDNNQNPGPGNYDPNSNYVRDSSPAAQMGKTNRADIVSPESRRQPGPGNYDSPSTIGKGPSHSIRGRDDSPPKTNHPGPGAYDASDQVTKVKNPAPSISRTSRPDIVGKEAKNQPGPGVYNQTSNIGKGPAAEIKGKRRDSRKNPNPGPGAYDASNSVTKAQNPSFKIPQTRREQVKQDDKPGPGGYDQHSTPGGPSYTIGEKRADRNRHDSPGPGAYDASMDLVKDRNSSPGFGNSDSPSRSIFGSPGRGQDYDNRDYDLPDHQGIAYTIPKAEPKDPANDSPGPGHYPLPSKFADLPSYANVSKDPQFKYV